MAWLARCVPLARAVLFTLVALLTWSCGGEPADPAAARPRFVKLGEVAPLGPERAPPRVGAGPWALDAFRVETGTRLAFRLGPRRDAVLRFSSAAFERLPGVGAPAAQASREVQESPAAPGDVTTEGVAEGPAEVPAEMPLVEPANAPAEEAAALQVRVSLGGQLLAEWAQPLTSALDPRPQEVPLPDGGPAVLRFEVQGPPAVWRLIAPVIGPAQIGRPGQRPWKDQPPNLLLFVADTLRADVLGAYGGEQRVTPRIDAFAAEALRFSRACAPSTWTLPSVSSILMGVYPPQHGAVAGRLKPTTAVTTLAQAFARAGYRTCAVTDSLFVSRKFGLDRGFESFFENGSVSVEATRAGVRRVLDADDGRPLLLLVHSYQAHEPYTMAPATRAENAERLGLQGSFEPIMAALKADFRAKVAEGLDPDLFLDEAAAERVDQLHRLYLGGILDLDRLFGSVLDELDRRGLAEHTVVAFTSDHGEGFLEHDTLGHGMGAWEEVLHVPLLLRIPGRDPGVLEHTVSTVDLASTLCQLSGLPPGPHWQQVSLLKDANAPPVFSFQVEREGHPPKLCVHGVGLKLVLSADPVAIRDGAVIAAYDLTRDPGEQHDLSRERAAEIESLGCRIAPRLEQLQQSIGPVDALRLDAEQLERLRAMGYLGDDG